MQNPLLQPRISASCFLIAHAMIPQRLDSPGVVSEVLGHLRAATRAAPAWSKAWHQWALFNVAVMLVRVHMCCLSGHVAVTLRMFVCASDNAAAHHLLGDACVSSRHSLPRPPHHTYTHTNTHSTILHEETRKP